MNSLQWDGNEGWREFFAIILLNVPEFIITSIILTVALCVAPLVWKGTDEQRNRAAFLAGLLVWVGSNQYRNVNSVETVLQYTFCPPAWNYWAAQLFTPVYMAIYFLGDQVARRVLRLIGGRYLRATIPMIGIASLVIMAGGFAAEVTGTVYLGWWRWLKTEEAFDGKALSLSWLLVRWFVRGFCFFSGYYLFIERGVGSYVRRGMMASLWMIGVVNVRRPFGNPSIVLMFAAALLSLFWPDRPVPGSARSQLPRH